MYNSYLYTIILIVVFDFVWEQILSYLNRKQMSSEIPELLKSIYPLETYAKQQLYQREHSYFGLIVNGFYFLVKIIILFTGSFGWLDNLLRQIFPDSIWLSLSFLGLILILNFIITFPFNWHVTFSIEEKFGFNKSTPTLFIIDWIKNLLLSITIGGLLVGVILFIYQFAHQRFWILAWGIVSGFSFLMASFYSEWIVPIFNKQTPLEKGVLRHSIEEFSIKVGFELKNIYIIDSSKRSTKGNAYFAGLGKKKRIILFDTLIKELKTEEIVAVLAHEIGHYKKKHIVYAIGSSFISNGIMCYILSLCLENKSLTTALGGIIPSFHLNIIGFSLLFMPIFKFIGLFSLFLQRKNEYEADTYANSFGLGKVLISGLKKLSAQSLSNLNPHKWTVFWSYSHPTLLQRIEHLSKTNI